MSAKLRVPSGVFPLQRWGDVLVVAGVLHRDRITIGEGGAGQLKSHRQTSSLDFFARRRDCAPGLGRCQRGWANAAGQHAGTGQIESLLGWPRPAYEKKSLAAWRHRYCGSTRSGDAYLVRVDLPQPLVADAKVVRNLVLDDVAHTFGQVRLAPG